VPAQLKLFTEIYYFKSLTLIEYLVALIKNADSDTQELYKATLCEDENGFPASIFDYIVEEVKDELPYNQIPNELIDIKWKLVNFAASDKTNLDFVLVHLTLIYNDRAGQRVQRSIAMTMEDFGVFNRKFNDLAESM
jgi:hypothetical protein